MPPQTDLTPFRIGRVIVDPARNIIANGPDERSVEPRIMEVLSFLAHSPETVFDRETLIQNVWRVEYGGDESLTRAISVLRKTFKDLGETGEIIETIPRRGYRLAQRPAAVSATALAQEGSGDPGTPARPRSPRNSGALIFFGVCFLFAIISTVVAITRQNRDHTQPRHSVAVLPFTAINGSEQDKQFADGLTDELHARLSAIRDLKIPGRAASRAYKDQPVSFDQIGKDLGVAFVLDGAVRRDGEQLRISAQLVSVSDGYEVWTRTYDRKIGDMFLVQEDIARRVGDALNVRIMGNAAQLKTTIGTSYIAAYDYYLEGRQLLNMRGAMVARAIERFENAIEIDPQYARAMAGLACAHSLTNSQIHTPKALARSRAASFARRAIAIDDGLAEPYAVLGAIEGDKNNWRAAMANFEFAKAREPNDVSTLYWRAETLMHLGYLGAAMESVGEALAVEPNSPALHLLAGHIANNQHDLELAEHHYRRVQMLGVDGAVFHRGLVLFQRGEIGKAANLIAAAYIYFQQVPGENASELSAMIARLMRGEGTVEQDLIAYPTLVDDDDARAISYLYSGRSEQALRLIESDADGDHEMMHYLWTNIDPALRSDPYFREFASNTGLLDYWLENGWPDQCRGTDETNFECDQGPLRK